MLQTSRHLHVIPLYQPDDELSDIFSWPHGRVYMDPQAAEPGGELLQAPIVSPAEARRRPGGATGGGRTPARRAGPGPAGPLAALPSGG